MERKVSESRENERGRVERERKTERNQIEQREGEAERLDREMRQREAKDNQKYVKKIAREKVTWQIEREEER